MISRSLVCLLSLVLCAGCATSSPPSANAAHGAGRVIVATDLDAPPAGNPFGSSAKSRKAVYLFSQGNTAQTDPQVLEFSDATLIRGWQKWRREGQKATDYDFGYPAQARARRIDFVGGGTASVVFRDEAGEAFEDWASRDARGNLVEHPYIVAGAYRASLANPAYRQSLIDFGKLQIDGGVSGLFFDELNAGGYNGGQVWQFNGNEGFDDFFLADFNAYLMKEHPDFTPEQWMSRYAMSADNLIQPDLPAGDLARNFNYRRYLQAHHWDHYPDDPANPLAPVWGTLIGNRPRPEAHSFREKAFDVYWREIVMSLREYARERYQREILITSNGLFPYVDFNSFGLYEYNRDDDGKEVSWIPVKNGQLDGSRSYQTVLEKLHARNRQMAGDVPLVLFIDWPTQSMNAYYGLSPKQKEDFWRIYAAEAYACGVFYAFHLKTAMPGEPTARDSGVLEFLKRYSQFYADRAALFIGAKPLPARPVTRVAKLTATLSEVAGKTLLHLVNHNYASTLIPQADFSVSLPLTTAPQRVVLHTPDAPSSRELAFSYANGQLTVQVDRLESYDLIVIE